MAHTSFKATFLTACILTTSMISVDALAQDPELAFYAKTKWVVEHVASKDESAPQTCTVSNKFNNGYGLQLAGTENGFTNINLDLKQNVFEAHTTYDVQYEVPGFTKKTVPTKAFKENLLVSDLRNDKSFAQQLTNAAVLDINISDNKFRMYLTGLNAAIKDFKACTTTGASFAATKQATEIMKTAAIEPMETTEIVESIASTSANEMTEESDTLEVVSSVTSETISSPEPVYNYTRNEEPLMADFTQEVAMAETLAQIEPVAGMPEVNESSAAYLPDAKDKLAALQQEIASLTQQNKALDQDLKETLRDSKVEEVSVSSNNWNLEKATMKFNEAERQIMRLGRKLQTQQAQCEAEKASLETMLFDPELTNQQQLVTLTSLETELDTAKTELFRQQRQYEERIKLLEQQLNAQ